MRDKRKQSTTIGLLGHIYSYCLTLSSSRDIFFSLNSNFLYLKLISTSVIYGQSHSHQSDPGGNQHNRAKKQKQPEEKHKTPHASSATQQKWMEKKA